MAKGKRKTHHSPHHSSHHTHHSTRHATSRHSSHHASSGRPPSQSSEDAERTIARAQEHFGHFEKSARSAFDTLGIFSGPMSQIMDQNWSTFQKTMQAVQKESLRFFNRRLEHASHLMAESRDFHGISGLMQLQQEWMLDFARDFSEQATRIANRMRELAMDSSEHLTEATSEALEEEDELEKEYEKEQREEGRHHTQ